MWSISAKLFFIYSAMDMQMRDNWDKVLTFLEEHCPDDVEFIKDSNGLITHVIRIQTCQCKFMHTMPVPVHVIALPDTPLGRQAHALYTYEFAQQNKHILLRRRRMPLWCKRFFCLCFVSLFLLFLSFFANARLIKLQSMSFQQPLDIIHFLLFG